MKIGIHASNNRSAGGQFQYLLMFLNALADISLAATRAGEDSVFAEDLEVALVFLSDEQSLAYSFVEERQIPHWSAIDLGQQLGLTGLAPDARRAQLRQSVEKIAAILRDEAQIDFIYFPTWTENCHRWGLPFAFAVHDLQHRLQPEFPEVSLGADLGGSWRWREEFFSAAFEHAEFSLVDSAVGRDHAARFYGVPAESCEILPSTIPFHSPAAAGAQADAAPPLPEKFFFYPAQFWPHKNHYRVVEAAGLLKSDHGLEIDLVFAGGHFPEWPVREICRVLAERLGIAERVHFLGYVPDPVVELLYARAIALVMPTFFGPTNIPYVEAFAAGCPVIASDLEGIREQVGEAGLLADPKDSRAIADAMRELACDEGLRTRLRELGKIRYREFSPERFAERLKDILSRRSG